MIYRHEHSIKSEAKMNNLDEIEEAYDHSSKHFSYYAFDGRTGSLRWQHEEGDFIPLDKHNNEEDAEEAIPDHSYKLHVLSDKSKHLGEFDWRVFKDDILQQLPHIWNSRDDTILLLKRFEKKRQSGGGNIKQHSWSLEGNINNNNNNANNNNNVNNNNLRRYWDSK
jgi:hypothetical protein